MNKESKNDLIPTKKRALGKTSKIKNREKKEKILKVAWKLFLQYGYEKTSLQMIVKEAGGSLATIYKIFNDKKTLFSETIQANGQDFIDSLDKDFTEVMASHSNLEEYFYRISVRLIRQLFSKENIAFNRLIIIEGYENPEILEIFHHIAVDRTRHFFLKALEDYNTIHHLEIEDIDASLRVFTNLIIEPYLMDAIMIPNHSCPSDDEIHRTVKRAIKIFMLYLKHYKEIK
ncbi:TetR/AcrR family transcriptional regulator [uncultured Helicobacter sp.]|uniref:TetR/AcrR family transcriptional regulator n=1 Tax=uncultured Helicobacter sp. TaxID=175537 RepID=UPI00263311FA|nr:TetR/AcrR family transcriptional regulator [uncultured Helicobacter sp.]